MTSLSSAQIARGLKEIGLPRGATVLVHTSLSSLGGVKDGARGVIEAIRRTVGPSGTIVMPTFMHGNGVFDRGRSSTGLGSVPETFRRMEDVVRSLHPLASVAAQGPLAEELIRDHDKAPTAHGEGTPYKRIVDRKGSVLLIGVDLDRATLMHTVETLADAPYLRDRGCEYLDEAGRRRHLVARRFPGSHRDFIGLDRRFRDAGVMRVGRIGKAVVRLLRASGMVREGLAAMREDPAAVLCDNPNCADCNWQRGKIKERRLREETFVLTAATGTIGGGVDDSLEALAGEGIRHVEIDRIDGRDLLELDESELTDFARSLREAGVSVAAVRSRCWESRFDGLVRAAQLTGAGRVVVPVELIRGEHVDAAVSAGLSVLVENSQMDAESCEKKLRKLEPTMGLSFNPARFAAIGQKPFLDAFHTKVSRYIRELVVADMTFAGEPTLLSRGNAEIKEMVSVLRCRCFGGPMVIRYETLPTGATFRDVAASFWQLLSGI